MRSATLPFSRAALIAAWTLGCAGAIGPGAGEPGAPDRGAVPTGPPASMPGPTPMGAPAPGPLADRPGPMPLRRLTRDELNNTLADLLGDRSAPARVLPVEGRGPHGFLEAGVVSTVDAEHLLDVVDAVGRAAAPRLPALIACDQAAMGEATCIQRFVTRLGRRAYRRPLTQAEVAALVDYHRSVETTLGYSYLEAARVVLEAMLLSPSFLYHWELGAQPATAQGGLVRLGPHEAASRLSYFLWSSMPDDALFAAVDGGRFATDADVEREARRMLADPRARFTVAAFHAQWLLLDKLADAQKDAKAYPMWSAELATAMAAETSQFVTRAVLDGDGSLRELLTSPASFSSVVLAKVYGVGPDATATMDRSALVPVTMDPAQRAGLFTQASFLTVNASALGSHPVKRGHKIFQDVLCGVISSPPAMVPPAGTPPANVSTREVFEAHDKEPCAVACHSLMDPIGFAFEHYDAVGRFRTTDGGKPVNSTGVLRPPSGAAAQPFQDAVELSKALAGLPDVRRCVTAQWFRYALGRSEGDGDEASLAAALDAFHRAGDNVRELIVALAKARSFLYRTPASGEVLR